MTSIGSAGGCCCVGFYPWMRYEIDTDGVPYAGGDPDMYDAGEPARRVRVPVINYTEATCIDRNDPDGACWDIDGQTVFFGTCSIPRDSTKETHWFEFNPYSEPSGRRMIETFSASARSLSASQPYERGPAHAYAWYILQDKTFGGHWPTATCYDTTRTYHEGDHVDTECGDGYSNHPNVRYSCNKCVASIIDMEWEGCHYWTANQTTSPGAFDTSHWTAEPLEVGGITYIDGEGLRSCKWMDMWVVFVDWARSLPSGSNLGKIPVDEATGIYGQASVLGSLLLSDQSYELDRGPTPYTLLGGTVDSNVPIMRNRNAYQTFHVRDEDAWGSTERNEFADHIADRPLFPIVSVDDTKLALTHAHAETISDDHWDFGEQGIITRNTSTNELTYETTVGYNQLCSGCSDIDGDSPGFPGTCNSYAGIYNCYDPQKNFNGVLNYRPLVSARGQAGAGAPEGTQGPLLIKRAIILPPLRYRGYGDFQGWHVEYDGLHYGPVEYPNVDGGTILNPDCETEVKYGLAEYKSIPPPYITSNRYPARGASSIGNWIDNDFNYNDGDPSVPHHPVRGNLHQQCTSYSKGNVSSKTFNFTTDLVSGPVGARPNASGSPGMEVGQIRGFTSDGETDPDAAVDASTYDIFAVLPERGFSYKQEYSNTSAETGPSYVSRGNALPESFYSHTCTTQANAYSYRIPGQGFLLWAYESGPNGRGQWMDAAAATFKFQKATTHTYWETNLPVGSGKREDCPQPNFWVGQYELAGIGVMDDWGVPEEVPCGTPCTNDAEGRFRCPCDCYGTPCELKVLTPAPYPDYDIYTGCVAGDNTWYTKCKDIMNDEDGNPDEDCGDVCTDYWPYNDAGVECGELDLCSLQSYTVEKYKMQCKAECLKAEEMFWLAGEHDRRAVWIANNEDWNPGNAPISPCPDCYTVVESKYWAWETKPSWGGDGVDGGGMYWKRNGCANQGYVKSCRPKAFDEADIGAGFKANKCFQGCWEICAGAQMSADQANMYGYYGGAASNASPMLPPLKKYNYTKELGMGIFINDGVKSYIGLKEVLFIQEYEEYVGVWDGGGRYYLENESLGSFSLIEDHVISNLYRRQDSMGGVTAQRWRLGEAGKKLLPDLPETLTWPSRQDPSRKSEILYNLGPSVYFSDAMGTNTYMPDVFCPALHVLQKSENSENMPLVAATWWDSLTGLPPRDPEEGGILIVNYTLRWFQDGKELEDRRSPPSVQMNCHPLSAQLFKYSADPLNPYQDPHHWAPTMEWSSDRWLYLFNFPMTSKSLSSSGAISSGIRLSSKIASGQEIGWEGLSNQLPLYRPPAGTAPTYDEAAYYRIRDVVTYNGNAYRAIKNSSYLNIPAWDCNTSYEHDMLVTNGGTTWRKTESWENLPDGNQGMGDDRTDWQRCGTEPPSYWYPPTLAEWLAEDDRNKIGFQEILDFGQGLKTIWQEWECPGFGFPEYHPSGTYAPPIRNSLVGIDGTFTPFGGVEGKPNGWLPSNVGLAMNAVNYDGSSYVAKESSTGIPYWTANGPYYFVSGIVIGNHSKGNLNLQTLTDPVGNPPSTATTARDYNTSYQVGAHVRTTDPVDGVEKIWRAMQRSSPTTPFTPVVDGNIVWTSGYDPWPNKPSGSWPCGECGQYDTNVPPAPNNEENIDPSVDTPGQGGAFEGFSDPVKPLWGQEQLFGAPCQYGLNNYDPYKIGGYVTNERVFSGESPYSVQNGKVFKATAYSVVDPNLWDGSTQYSDYTRDVVCQGSQYPVVKHVDATLGNRFYRSIQYSNQNQTPVPLGTSYWEDISSEIGDIKIGGAFNHSKWTQEIGSLMDTVGISGCPTVDVHADVIKEQGQNSDAAWPTAGYQTKPFCVAGPFNPVQWTETTLQVDPFCKQYMIAGPFNDSEWERYTCDDDPSNFSESATYDIGDVVIYDEYQYVAIVEISSPGSFDSSQWQILPCDDGWLWKDWMVYHGGGDAGSDGAGDDSAAGSIWVPIGCREPHPTLTGQYNLTATQNRVMLSHDFGFVDSWVFDALADSYNVPLMPPAADH